VKEERGDSEHPSDIVGVPFCALKRTNCDLKVRPKLMGNHLGAQKGTWTGPPESPDWNLQPNLGFLPEKPRPLDFKGEQTGKRVPFGGGFFWLNFFSLS
jgi:hypothetical protein